MVPLAQLNRQLSVREWPKLTHFPTSLKTLENSATQLDIIDYARWAIHQAKSDSNPPSEDCSAYQ
jgi:hypothetical protein